MELTKNKESKAKAKTVHGGVDGGRSQEKARSQMLSQGPARTRPQGESSHGADLMEGTLGTTDGDDATDEDPGGADRPISPRKNDGTGD